MFPHTKRLFQRHAAKVFDLCILITSFALATASLYSSPKTITLAGFMAMRIRLGTILLFVLLLAIWHGVFVMCGLYESKRLTTWRAETYELLRATCLASILLLGLARMFHIFIVQPTFVLLFWVFCTSLMISSRLGARSILLNLRRHGRNSRFLLIIGTNSRAMEFARHVNTSPELGYRIVGFVDDEWQGIRSFDETGNVRCCNFAGLADFLRHNVVDEAAIYLPLRSYYKHSAQLASLGNTGSQCDLTRRCSTWGRRTRRPRIWTWSSPEKARVGPLWSNAGLTSFFPRYSWFFLLPYSWWWQSWFGGLHPVQLCLDRRA